MLIIVDIMRELSMLIESDNGHNYLSIISSDTLLSLSISDRQW